MRRTCGESARRAKKPPPGAVTPTATSASTEMRASVWPSVPNTRMRSRGGEHAQTREFGLADRLGDDVDRLEPRDLGDELLRPLWARPRGFVTPAAVDTPQRHGEGLRLACEGELEALRSRRLEAGQRFVAPRDELAREVLDALALHGEEGSPTPPRRPTALALGAQRELEFEVVARQCEGEVGRVETEGLGRNGLIEEALRAQEGEIRQQALDDVRIGRPGHGLEQPPAAVPALELDAAARPAGAQRLTASGSKASTRRLRSSSRRRCHALVRQLGTL